MFSRTAGAPLIAANDVRLLEDGRENYAAWLEAIRGAKRTVHFENYFLRDDRIGTEFAEAFIERAHSGIRVRLLLDWMGSLGKASGKFWKRLRAAGVEVRIFSPPQLSSPLGWLSRNHRKSLVVDGEAGFVSGLCVGSEWLPDAARSAAEAWRDTGVGIRGPAVASIARAFARSWSLAGEPLPPEEILDEPGPAGNVSLRIVSTEPSIAGMLRLDQLVASIARHRLWLSDAYYSGTSTYLQALKAAAQDGVDVRLLVPHATDIPVLQPFSRAGYRALLEVGVRVFEWNGTMLHAKTAVADGRWARVGSTNLNLASWLGNCELDAVIEDSGFAARMEEMYLHDLENATELVLDDRRKVCAPGQPRRPHPAGHGASGSAGGVAAGALRIGYVMGAAVTRRRVLESGEGRMIALAGVTLCALAALLFVYPHIVAWPAAVLVLWGGLALSWKAFRRDRAP